MRLWIVSRPIVAGREVNYDSLSRFKYDKIGLQIRKFKDGSIDKAEFLNRMKYMKGVTYQYFFGSERAVKYLTRV